MVYGHDSVPFKLRPLWLFETENSSEESRDSIICTYALVSPVLSSDLSLKYKFLS